MARKSKLPRAADFFGGEEAEEKKTPEAEAAEEGDETVRLTEEAIEEGRRLAQAIEGLSDEDDKQAAAMIEAAKKAEKAVERLRAVEEATRHRPRVVPSIPGEKVTFYLPLDMVKQLEVIKVRLLVEHNLKATRSQIVEVLLEGMGERVEQVAEALEGAGE